MGALNQGLTTASGVVFSSVSASTLDISGTITAPNIGTGVDNSVIVLEADGTFGTDEIDSRVWGSTLVDGAGNTPQITYWSDANTITGTSTFVYSGGNVGIGTVAPSSVLDVQVTTATLLTETARFSKVNSGTRGISFGGSHGSAGGYNWIKSFGTTHNLAFLDTDDHINMVISNAGDVGIGTTNPTSKLEVNTSGAHTIVTIHADNGYGSRIQFDTGDTAQIRAYNGNGVAADRSLAFQVGGNTYQHIKNNGRIGINTTSPLSQLHIRGHVSQSHSGSLFRVEGSSGSLFEVVDSLSGSLMSVNDISGLPIFEVFSDDKVIMGQYGQNALVVTGSRVGIGTAAPIASLDVSGSIVISDSSGTFTLPSTQQLFLDGGGDTYIREYSADLIQFVAGGNSAL